MSFEVEFTKGDDEDASCGLLLRDIEEISKALYLHKSPLKAFNASYDDCKHVVAKTGTSESKSNVVIRDSLHKDKKSSIWNWKPLKALTHSRNHRFNCCFFLHVHTIEGLPSNFDNLNLCVTWKRKADMLRTRPAGVYLGTAEFEETLMHRCTIYGRTGPHNSVKYEPKLFSLHASVIGAPTDIGNHLVDLSRLLPLTLEELEGGRRSSGKWTTSFKLTGNSKGAILNVSFGFSVLDSNSFEPGSFVKVPHIVQEGNMNHFADFDWRSRTSQLDNHNLDAVTRISAEGSYHHSQSLAVKFLEEIMPKQGSELSHSVSLLYRKLDEGKMGSEVEFDLSHEHLRFLKPKSEASPESASGNTGLELTDTEFDVIEQGVEVSLKDQMGVEKCGSQRFDSSVIETIDVAEIFKGEDATFDEHVGGNSKLDRNNRDEYGCPADDPEHRDNSMCIIEPALEELDSAFHDVLTSKPSELDSFLDIVKYYVPENYIKSKSIHKAERLTKSLSLDDVAESIENDFLNMLSIDLSQEDMVCGSGPDLPGIPLRGFEEDALAGENPTLNTDFMAEQEDFTSSSFTKVTFADDFDLSFAIQAVERKQGSVTQPLRSKRNAKILENLETEALMNEWGLNEKAFQYSPHASSGGFGSPVYLPAEEPLRLPSLEEGVGPIIRTKDGGFFRSMNPLHFRNANNGARLIVQVSAPVVLPSAMGFTVMEILQCWASGGVEKMCIQANELMPLEDVTGKTMQQVLSESESRTDARKRWALQRKSEFGLESFVEKKPAENRLDACSNCELMESDYVSFEDLIPMAITNIEGLLVEGLKIQSGMPGQEAPSSIRIQLPRNSASLGKVAEFPSNLGSEGASGLQNRDLDDIIKYSMSLEEWIRLDSGEFYVEDENEEIVSELFAAYCAKSVELGSGQHIREDKSGVFGNNFRMGLKVQLRDPLRNYEMVGSSMLALFQVDRVCSARQPEQLALSSEELCIGEKDGLNEHIFPEGTDSEQNRKKLYDPLFKVSEVHLAGLNSLHGNKLLWGTSRQQQSGYRWLHSSGMARSNKNLIFGTNAVPKSSSGLMKKSLPGHVLWSISIPIQGEAATWNEHVALNVHVRNPDIVFPTKFVK
ncbi:protein PLASTID MOVEMENT IMPAIRED 1-RELATED 1 isoform X1 [Sesamum indicum]|uniref:Protein PLASTID MOVEMENT IMPAIRED 1-RELATED 1 isoform X1 n=1 Tax=Sesamum indicum TaxID=4182 RepID=A0A6I9UNQ7_SESIN|nr:protein PLASTID MOVEMENT IMPAIRED 1-RELATED 1 isoform X1 [Sesamum indicum]XP_020548075.1 protein PLASTID MOVEMENT IMPAIRED 1-RELATED 1 isoform X1 [Sesamum indicum]